MKTIRIPCMVGDTVYADFRENYRRLPQAIFSELTEAEVVEIAFIRDYKEPLFTVMRGDEVRTFWLSDFGHDIYVKGSAEE